MEITQINVPIAGKKQVKECMHAVLRTITLNARLIRLAMQMTMRGRRQPKIIGGGMRHASSRSVVDLNSNGGGVRCASSFPLRRLATSRSKRRPRPRDLLDLGGGHVEPPPINANGDHRSGGKRKVVIG
ncbi:hypothetical protein QYF36_022930 [Acer negundo]|nr:hypothetical protein QYF36_022930 [Acer negundo]